MINEMDGVSLERMMVDLDSLKEFEASILSVLDDLTSGSVSAVNPVDGVVKADDYGTGFNEAYFIAWGTIGVVEHVKRLATMLHQQIEAMAMTIQMAGDKTVAADDGAKQKLSKLLYGDGKSADTRPYSDKPTQVAPSQTSAGTGASTTEVAGTG
ncbi:hypothetical protein [Yinghuangia soli]|uniref:Uncharacterized protein n=1 Tax=Yinghuangia soli TaxID=2908204 RepID=A0AA41Q6Q1_9ACTN|nr:hypothetical protein [Yinghuangia soli]MCF2531369.1 hypothetical protein [Yinghuangia soli]